MKILDVLSDTPWAIMPDKKVEIDEIYMAHTRREKIDLDAVEKRLGAPLNNQPKGYEVVQGVAVVPVDGVIAKRMGMFTRISGGVSTVQLQNDLKQALNDPAVKAVILRIDSPGGSVDGTQELADMVYQSRGGKPIVALADGLMASAAYWIGSGADQVLMSCRTTAVGSIGVVATHVDVSKYEESMGYKTTEITAGKFKRVESQYGPLSEEGRATIQGRVDAIYSEFLSGVARNRGLDSAEVAHEQMGDGRIFIGQAAIDAGLVDGVSTLSELIDRLSKGEAGPQKSPSQRRAGAAVAVTKAESDEPVAGGASENHNSQEGADMADVKVEIDASAIQAELETLKKDFDAKAGELREEGASMERERIKGVLDIGATMRGHEGLIQGLAFDGKTTRAEALEKVFDAEGKKRASVNAALHRDAPAPVTPSKEEPTDGPGADAPLEERAKHEWDKSAEVREEFSGRFSAFLAFKKAEAAGTAKILKTR